jgi:hypothetical protein
MHFDFCIHCATFGDIMTRCSNCVEPLLNDMKETAWFRLVNIFEFLRLQGDITQELYDSALSDLMFFKKFAMKERWEIEEQLDEMKSKYNK